MEKEPEKEVELELEKEPEKEVEVEKEPEKEVEVEVEKEPEKEVEVEVEVEKELELELEKETRVEVEVEAEKELKNHILGKKPKTKFNLDKINKINEKISQEHKILNDEVKIDNIIEKMTNNINLDLIELINIYKSNDKNIINTAEIFLLKILKKIENNRLF